MRETAVSTIAASLSSLVWGLGASNTRCDGVTRTDKVKQAFARRFRLHNHPHMVADNKHKHPSPMRSTIPKLAALLLVAVFVVALGRAIYLDTLYAARLPRAPDPSAGRVHEVSVQHGTHVFASDSEVRDLRNSKIMMDFAVLAGLGAVILNVKFRIWSRGSKWDTPHSGG